jgi:hypothetical protein
MFRSNPRATIIVHLDIITEGYGKIGKKRFDLAHESLAVSLSSAQHHLFSRQIRGDKVVYCDTGRIAIF